MARIDDYINAKKIAVEKLSQKSTDDIVNQSGFEILESSTIHVPFLNRTFMISIPDDTFTDLSDTDKEVPIQEQVLILHYMLAENTDTPAGNWVSYREIPGASFYFSAFIKRAVDPLKKVFGNNISGFKDVSEQLHGRSIDIGDAGVDYWIFPRVPIRIILWKGDDEFLS